MRPKSIRWFDWLFFASLVPSLVNTALNIAAPLPSAHHRASSTTHVSTVALVYGVNLIIWFFISRRGSRVAKWCWMAMLLLAAIGLREYHIRLTHGTLPELREMDEAIGWALTIAATIMLFRPDASAWFAARGKPVDPASFG